MIKKQTKDMEQCVGKPLETKTSGTMFLEAVGHKHIWKTVVEIFWKPKQMQQYV